jgi:hypothetical protein
MPRQKQLRYWTCAVANYREEWRAAHYIEKSEFQFYLPQVYEEDDRRVLMFPGHIFILVREGWQVLAHTTGIRRLMLSPTVRTRHRDDDPVLVPSVVRSAEIRALKDMEDSKGVVVLRSRFAPGDRVTVDDKVKSFGGLSGIVGGTPAVGRVRVLFAMLGKSVPREFGEAALRPA